MWSPWQVPTELSEEERKKWEAIPVKKFWIIMAIIIITMALLLAGVGSYLS
jgi:hypothetical protein|tara:strand:+ start:615 stop:767 length:153 start_codon:yes stop_codon:yes gene_type:complete